MKHYLYYGLLSFSVLFLLNSCGAEEELPNCQKDSHAVIRTVNLSSETIPVRQDVVIDVLANLDNSCGTFKNMEIDKNGFVWEIKMIARYEGCDCEEIALQTNTSFVFRSAQEGTFRLVFQNPDGNADIVKEIVVTRQ